MVFRFIAARWAEEQGLSPRAFEGEYSFEQVLKFNERGYNCYYFPNHPSDYAAIPLREDGKRKRPIQAADIDTFNYCFIDLDMKDYQSESADRRHDYKTKQEFIDEVLAFELPPTSIVDSGGGVHVYWRVTDLDAMSWLRLQRRLCRRFRTDPAVALLNQLMRVPGTVNVKKEDDFRLCEVVQENPDAAYDADTFNNALPPIRPNDEEYCQGHYDKAYNINIDDLKLTEELPANFLRLVGHNKKAHDLFYTPQRDRSTADYRLAHIMHGNGITKDEARAVLFNTDKASERTKLHRYNYASNIVDKIWEAESKATAASNIDEIMPESAKNILADSSDRADAVRFPCHPMIDATKYGFRLTHVMGLIGGSGNGKTTTALNLFSWFTEANANKDYIHVYVSLEMTKAEIASLWSTLSTQLASERPDIPWNDLVYILDNYNKDGSYRELSLDDIKDYVIKLEAVTKKKVGAVVIDHIGILKETKGQGEFDGIIGNCKKLKSFAVATKTFLVIQSQTSRSKNGGGDVELDMDAAFGTSTFENFCDWIMTTWQPLKRIIHKAPNMTVTAFKFAKMRHKKVLLDDIKENVVYGMMYDPNTGRLRELTSDEHTTIKFYAQQATAARNKDKKREPSDMAVITWTKPSADQKGPDGKPVN